MEETLLKFEKKMSGEDISEYLRNIAEKVEKGEKLKLESGKQKVELDTDRDAEFEVKVERDEKDDEESLELEIEWKNKASGLEMN